MKRGPKTPQRTAGHSTATMRAHWGDEAPDWVVRLAEECDRDSQSAVARRIGYSPAVVSHVLKARYPGDLAAVEKAVRGAFMAGTVDCPVLGPIAGNDCLQNQRRPFSAANAQRLRLFKACRSDCPHSRLKGGRHAEQ